MTHVLDRQPGHGIGIEVSDQWRRAFGPHPTPMVRESKSPCSTVGRIGLTEDQTVGLESTNNSGEALTADLEVPRHIADRHSWFRR